MLTAEKGEPTRVSHEKERFCGVLIPDFGVRFEDVEAGDEPRAGFTKNGPRRGSLVHIPIRQFRPGLRCFAESD